MSTNRAYGSCSVVVLLSVLAGCNTDSGGCWLPSGQGSGAGGAPVFTSPGGSNGDSPGSEPQGAGGAEPVDCGPSDPVSCQCSGSVYCAWTADAKNGVPKPDHWCTYDGKETYPVPCSALKTAMLGACLENSVNAEKAVGSPYAEPSGWKCSTVFVKCTEK